MPITCSVHHALVPLRVLLTAVCLEHSIVQRLSQVGSVLVFVIIYYNTRYILFAWLFINSSFPHPVYAHTPTLGEFTTGNISSSSSSPPFFFAHLLLQYPCSSAEEYPGSTILAGFPHTQQGITGGIFLARIAYSYIHHLHHAQGHLRVQRQPSTSVQLWNQSHTHGSIFDQF